MNARKNGLNRLRHLIEEDEEAAAPEDPEIIDTRVEVSSSSFFSRKPSEPIVKKIAGSTRANSGHFSFKADMLAGATSRQ